MDIQTGNDLFLRVLFQKFYYKYSFLCSTYVFKCSQCNYTLITLLQTYIALYNILTYWVIAKFKHSWVTGSSSRWKKKKEHKGKNHIPMQRSCHTFVYPVICELAVKFEIIVFFPMSCHLNGALLFSDGPTAEKHRTPYFGLDSGWGWCTWRWQESPSIFAFFIRIVWTTTEIR